MPTTTTKLRPKATSRFSQGKKKSERARNKEAINAHYFSSDHGF